MVCGLACLACVGPLGPPPPYTAELTAPWTELGLPLGDGRVTFSSEDLLTVHHPRQSVEKLSAAYASALEASGMVRGLDTSSDDMTSVTFADASVTVALGVLSSKQETIVSLTRFPK